MPERWHRRGRYCNVVGGYRSYFEGLATSWWIPVIYWLCRGGRLDVRRRAYTEEGWTRFDENAAPYTEEQVAAERNRCR